MFYDDTGEFELARLAADIVNLESSPFGESLILEGGRLSGKVHRPVLNASGGLGVEVLGPDIESVGIATKPEGKVTLVGRTAAGDRQSFRWSGCRVDSKLLEAIKSGLSHSRHEMKSAL